jgi:hypothetical protein
LEALPPNLYFIKFFGLDEVDGVWKSILKFLEPFSIAKRFQTSKKLSAAVLRPWRLCLQASVSPFKKGLNP